MRILFISPADADGAQLCRVLQKEGHDVRYLILDRSRSLRKILDGVIKKVRTLEQGLKWLGGRGSSLIVFDDVGAGKLADALTCDGWSVVGSCEAADKLELSREYGEKVLLNCGLSVPYSKSFRDLSEALLFLKSNQGPWVIKQDGKAHKTLNYVGKFPDNRDTLSLLENYCHNGFCRRNLESIQIQKRLIGVEMGVARYFNGRDWVGPIEINFEHKDLFPNSSGPKTDEMGTLMWYTDDEQNKLFQETLVRLKPYLQDIGFRGDIDINCIVNEHGAFPLEITPRFGYPALQLQIELHQSPWGEFLKALADGKQYHLRWRKGYGIVVLLATPPFPYYRKGFSSFSPKGLTIHFRDGFSPRDFEHIHFAEVARKDTGEYYVCGDSGYVLLITGVGETVQKAREKVYTLFEKIVVPKKYYRDDIGVKFIREDQEKLRAWGYL
jgi:phosphoribosylamine--glycine ligase